MWKNASLKSTNMENPWHLRANLTLVVGQQKMNSVFSSVRCIAVSIFHCVGDYHELVCSLP